MARPKIKIELTAIDKAVELIGWFALLTIWVLTNNDEHRKYWLQQQNTHMSGSIRQLADTLLLYWAETPSVVNDKEKRGVRFL